MNGVSSREGYDKRVHDAGHGQYEQKANQQQGREETGVFGGIWFLHWKEAPD